MVTKSATELIGIDVLIEPTRLEDLPESIADVVADLASATAMLGSRLNRTTAMYLSAMVRIVETHFSYLMDGYDVKPADLERALFGDLHHDAGRRNLQLAAYSYMRVKDEIDNMATAGSLPEPASLQFITWLHREIYRDMPEELLRISRNHITVVMEPGEWRRLAADNLNMSGDTPPPSDQVDELMRHFEARYRFASMGKAARIMAMAAAHHRFNYIQPFPIGNGSVSRLLTYAMALKAGVGAHGLWSVSRGLALGLESRGDYRTMMSYADTPRQGSLDGKGNLSQRALREYTLWFLKVCLDQVNFMSSLLDPDNLALRLRNYVERSKHLKPEATMLLHEAMKKGQFDRGEAPRITGLPERTARRVLNDLINEGVLASPTPKTPVSLRFPTQTLDLLFPKLYPEL